MGFEPVKECFCKKQLTEDTEKVQTMARDWKIARDEYGKSLENLKDAHAEAEKKYNKKFERINKRKIVTKVYLEDKSDFNSAE